jgi:2-keto-4-pentenoate hydratase
VSGLDARIAAGMREQLAARDEHVRVGDRQIGWKVGFWAPAARERFGIGHPLVGFLTESRVVADGGSVPVGDWAAPMLEAEIAVHLDAEVAPDAGRAEVLAAIGGLSAAIELADLDPPPEDVARIVAGNVYHRHVVLGPVDASRRTGEGIGASVAVDGREVAVTDDPASLTGEIVEVVRLTAELLGACGERLRAGDVVITGSAVPPVAVAPGQHVEARLGPLGALTVRLA